MIVYCAPMKWMVNTGLTGNDSFKHERTNVKIFRLKKKQPTHDMKYDTADINS